MNFYTFIVIRTHMKKLILIGEDKGCEKCISREISLVEELHGELDYFILEILQNGQEKVEDFDYAVKFDSEGERPIEFRRVHGTVYNPLLRILEKYNIKRASTELPPGWWKNKEIKDYCSQIIANGYSICMKGLIVFFGTGDVKYVPGILKNQYGIENEAINVHSEHQKESSI